MVLEGEQCGERWGGSYSESQMSENIHCGGEGNRVFLFLEFSGGGGSGKPSKRMRQIQCMVQNDLQDMIKI